MPKKRSNIKKIRKQFDVTSEVQELIDELVKRTKSNSEAEAYKKSFRLTVDLVVEIEAGATLLLEKDGEIKAIKIIW